MTPRQFDLLCRRRREDLAHRELGPAQTTAAVINFSQLRPKDPASPIDFMPNHRDAAAPEPEMDEETLERVSNYNVLVAEEAARQRKAAAERGE